MSTVPAAPPPWPTWYRATRVGASLCPLIAVHAAVVAALLYLPISWWDLFLAFVVTRFAGLGVTVGYHRYFAHKAFKTSRTVQFLLGAAGCTALQKGPVWWVVHHRDHHRHSDTPLDPHSPVVDGFWYGHMGWLLVNDLTRPDTSGVRDLTRYPELMWLERLWMFPGLLLAAACYAAGGWPGVAYGYCLAVVLTFQVTFAVNSVGHLWGPRRFATGDGSRNNWALGVLAMGDGWHNNHHRAPSSARHGLAWYEVDQAYLVIRFLRTVGLVWGVKEPPPMVLAAARAKVQEDDASSPVGPAVGVPVCVPATEHSSRAEGSRNLGIGGLRIDAPWTPS